MLNLKHDYTIKTVDNRKYYYESSYIALGSVYREVMSNDYIEVTKGTEDKKIIVDTKHIVSIE